MKLRGRSPPLMSRPLPLPFKLRPPPPKPRDPVCLLKIPQSKKTSAVGPSLSIPKMHLLPPNPTSSTPPLGDRMTMPNLR